MAVRGKPIPLVTRAQLAKVLGISLRKVTELEQTEVLVPKRLGRGGRPSLYDLALAVPAYIGHVSDGSKVANPERDARTRKDVAQAVLTELRIAKEEGSMVSRDDVVQQGQAFAKGLSATIRGLPRRATQAGAIERNQEPALAEICRDVLTEISSWKGFVDAERASKNGSPEP